MIESYKKFIITFVALGLAIVMTFLLFMDNASRKYEVSEFQLTDLPASAIEQKKDYKRVERTCLLLADSTQEMNDVFCGHLEDVLSDLRVPYEVVDISKRAIPDFFNYKTTVISFQNLDRLGDAAIELCNWVQSGGACMLFATPEPTPVFRYLSPYLGIDEGGVSYTEIRGMTLKKGFMIGGDDFNFHWGEPMVTSMSVNLNSKATVYAESDNEGNNPLIWAAACGKGRFVVNNNGFAEKATRGLTASAYNLLENTSIYPVINASAFFLDDFPSPVPMGDGTYIRRDYNRDISSFYSSIWWPDMLKLCDDYGIKYTGLIIETYSDEVDGVFPRQTDIERFTHFGSMLYNKGGEVGLHGYNHQPFCFTGFDFKNQVDYNTWPSEEKAATAVREAILFTRSVFPKNEIAVYVPPSNILSEEGRAFLKNYFPQIKVIASLYLEGIIEYSQEFEIAEDGVIEFPRVISGAILDHYMRWDALNTLNLYYVNSHFMHPDDVLDEDRGAKDGWEKLYGNLTHYADWLYRSAPSLRNLTGSDAGRATARYDVLSFERTDKENSIDLRLNGLWDEAYLMVRCNDQKPTEVEGGTIERVTGDFYLLRATQDKVSIKLG